MPAIGFMACCRIGSWTTSSLAYHLGSRAESNGCADGAGSSTCAQLSSFADVLTVCVFCLGLIAAAHKASYAQGLMNGMLSFLSASAAVYTYFESGNQHVHGCVVMSVGTLLDFTASCACTLCVRLHQNTVPVKSLPCSLVMHGMQLHVLNRLLVQLAKGVACNMSCVSSGLYMTALQLLGFSLLCRYWQCIPSAGFLDASFSARDMLETPSLDESQALPVPASSASSQQAESSFYESVNAGKANA